NSYLINTVLNNFIAAFAGTPIVSTVHSATASALQGSTSTYNGIYNWVTTGVPNPGISIVPRAYINWILFNEQFVPIASNCGYDGVSTTADAVKSHSSAVSISTSGYLYVYCSNESNIDVFFDNLQLIHTRGPLLETTDYYPFGLTMAGISDKALKSNYAENKYRFGGKEIQHQEFSDGTGMEDYDFGNRMLDPQIGRWWKIDPLSEFDRKWSPYNYTKDNPIRFIDPDGMWTVDANGNETTSNPNEIKTFLNSLNFDQGQRRKAKEKAKEYIDKKPEGNSYEMSAKGKPGNNVDCSGMQSECAIAGGEPDPINDKTGATGTGVQRIEHNTKKLDENDVVSGNYVTFYFPAPSSWPTHIGLLIDIERDENGKIVAFTMRDSHSGVGPDERRVVVGSEGLGSHINGYYKWDTNPDTPMDAKTNAEYNRLLQISKMCDQKGLKNAASLYRRAAEKLKTD
ncbi:MAG TPA: RHS repeat-associated core domain-containing protein, partial [Patescibacteria group bacterium]